MNRWRHGWFDTQQIACRGTEHNQMGKTPDQRRTGKRWRRQAVEFGEKAEFLMVAARREGRVAGDAERMLDGICVGHHERTGASLFLSESGMFRGTSVQRRGCLLERSLK